MTRSSMNNNIILVARHNQIMIISANMMKNWIKQQYTYWVLAFEKTNGADGTKTVLWTALPKNLFALSQCKILKAKDSRDLLSHSPVHADARDGEEPAIPTSRRPTKPRSTRAQPTKVSGLTQPKRLAWWVRTSPPYMLCSPTINFRCGTKSNRHEWLLLLTSIARFS